MSQKLNQMNLQYFLSISYLIINEKEKKTNCYSIDYNGDFIDAFWHKKYTQI